VIMSKQLYYIQDKRQVVGNSVLWWGKNSRGYVTELEEAGLYPESKLPGLRSTDIPYKKEDIEAVACTHIRVETLGRINGLLYEQREIERLEIENKELKNKADRLDAVISYLNYSDTVEIDDILSVAETGKL